MVILGIASKCNFNCLFCLDKQSKGSKAPSLGEIIELFKEISRSREDTIMLMQGESLIRPDFFEILKAARRHGLKVYVTTNGSMLSYYDFLVKIIKEGVGQLNMSVHSHIPAVANAISRNSSCYRLQQKALENIDLYNSLQKGKGKIPLHINTVVCKLNYKHLEGLVFYLKGLLKHTDFRMKFKSMVCGDNNIKLYRKLLPSFKETERYLSKVLSTLNKSRVYFSGFPLCAAPFYEWACVELQETLHRPNLYLESCSFKDSKMQNDVVNQEFCKYKECKECSLHAICLGVRKDYFRAYPKFNLKLSGKDSAGVARAVALTTAGS